MVHMCAYSKYIDKLPYFELEILKVIFVFKIEMEPDRPKLPVDTMRPWTF